MRRTLFALAVSTALMSAMSAMAAPEKSLLGVRIMSDWKAVLAKHGQPSRIEAGPVTGALATPQGGIGGAGVMGSSMMGATLPMGGIPGMPTVGATAARPGSLPGLGGMGPMAGAAMPGMMSGGGMSTRAAAMRGAMSGMPSMPGMMSGGAAGPGRGPGMMGGPPSGIAAMSGLMTGSPMMGRGSSMGGPPIGMLTPPSMGGNRMGSSAVGAEGTEGAMAGGPMGGMLGSGMAGQAFGRPTDAAEGEVSWVYEKGTDTKVFLFNNQGRVIQIQSFGYKAGARTMTGVGLGDPKTRIYALYGFPEQTTASGNTLTLDYSKRANVAFQLADRRDGKGMRVVGIVVALVEAPKPEEAN